jgi:hypothetical protein
MALRKQLMALETELRDSGIVYGCRQDTTIVSAYRAMLTWTACHPHLSSRVNVAMSARRPRKPRKPRQTFGWKALT